MKFVSLQRKTRDITEIYNGTDPLRPLPQYAKSVDTNVSPRICAVQIGIKIIRLTAVQIIYHHAFLICAGKRSF